MTSESKDSFNKKIKKTFCFLSNNQAYEKPIEKDYHISQEEEDVFFLGKSISGNSVKNHAKLFHIAPFLCY